MNSLIPNEILGWRAEQDTQTYDRETIFDYIDGAGEVYRLYDFRNVFVKRFLRTDHPVITVELFDMGKSGDAYGVFSHSREGGGIGVGAGSEFRGGILCFWKSRYFVCAYSEKSSEETDKAVVEIARAIDGRIKGESRMPDIIGYLPDDGLIESSIIYFHKQSSLNYHYYLAEENLLNLDENTEAVLAQYEPDKARLLCIKYGNPTQAEEAFESFINGYMPETRESALAEIDKNKWVKASTIGDLVVVVLDAPDTNRAMDLVNAVKKHEVSE